MQKNTAAQYFHCIVFNASGRVSGDAANLSCELAIDNGARSALSTNTATEIGTTGEYTFPLTQAETNGHELSFTPESSSGYQVVGQPSNVIYTAESPNITYVIPQSVITQATAPSGTEIVTQASQWTIMVEGIADTEYSNIDGVLFGIKAFDSADTAAALQIRWDKSLDTTEVLYAGGQAIGPPLDTTGATITHASYTEDTVTYHRFTAVIKGPVTALVPTTGSLNDDNRLGDVLASPQITAYGYSSEWKFVGTTDMVIASGYIIVNPTVNKTTEG